MKSDGRLARRAARGDQDAFAAIFRRYQQDLYRYCVAILGDPQDAQDALQNTMVKALRALPGEQREIELKPWLYRVAHNESIELRRRTRPSEPLADEVPAPGASLEQRAADRRRLRDLLADVAELPERHRGALVMRELAGFDFEEIGAALDTSPGAARQVLYEARRGLQQMSEGREMECDAVTALLSDLDGRVARRRDVRAHLRDCPECRRFAEGIRTRSEALAGIAPLPAIAAAAIAKGALSGTAGGGAAAGASVGGASGGASGGAAGLAGGAAKVASTGAILKSATAVVAVVAVGGAVAVDQGQPFRGGDSSAGTTHGRAPVTRTADGGPGAAGADGDSVAAKVEAGSPRGLRGGRRPGEARLGRPAVRSAGAPGLRPDVDAPGADAGPAPTATSSGPGDPGSLPSTQEPSPNGPRAGRSPDHPTHPGHPARPVHPTHPVHPTRPAKPSHPEKAAPSHPAKAAHPEQPANPEASDGQETPARAENGPEGPEDAGGTQAVQPEQPEPDSPSTSAESSAPVEGAAAAEPAEPAAEPPGRAKQPQQ